MDEAYILQDFLPLSYKSKTEQDYIAFLWDAFETNYANEKYQFAFLAYHMLTMAFVYFNVWQIKQQMKDDFGKAMIGFNKDMEKELLNATTPFTFWRVNESAVMRFMKLIGCDNGQCGAYAELVKERNQTAHCNGQILYNDAKSLDRKIVEALRVVDEIQHHSQSVIEKCYLDFLEGSGDPEEREYDDDTDQIREILIHGNYFSQRDIDICLECDLATLMDDDQFSAIAKLHEKLHESYS